MTGAPPIEADGASKVRAGIRALDGVSLRVERGEIHAVVGLNGAGKTTLLRALLGMLSLDSGQVRLFGTELGVLPGEAWSRVGHMLEVPFAYPELTVGENVFASARLHGLDRTAGAQAARQALRQLDIEGLSLRKVRTLSAGNRQRTGLAAALAHNPEVIILDEPTNTLDPRGVVILRELLRRARERGTAVLVSSHHLDEVARLADRITVLHVGKTVGSLDPGSTDLERRFFDIVLEADQQQERP